MDLAEPALGGPTHGHVSRMRRRPTFRCSRRESVGSARDPIGGRGRRGILCQRDLMESFAALLATMLEKEDAMRRAQEARISMESQKLQRALLDNFSHELKTPLSVLAGTFSVWAGSAVRPDRNMISEASNAVSRLGFVVSQMVDLTQLDSGLIQPTWDGAKQPTFFGNGRTQRPRRKDRPLLNRCPCRRSRFIFRWIPYLLNTALDNMLNNAFRHAPADTADRYRGRS